LNQKQVYEMERNNLGMMYQYSLEVGLIQINKATQKGGIRYAKEVSFSISSYKFGFW